MNGCLEVPNAYSFNLYYMKGRHMTLGDFYSRIIVDKSNPQEILQILFDLQEVLQVKFLYSHQC